MPELPEVNSFKKYFDKTSLHQKVAAVEIYDNTIIRHDNPDYFAENLKGKVFNSSFRRGKYLFPRLDNNHHILLHFGMTGDLQYYSAPEDRTRHERFTIIFENGYRLGFDCPRKFARIMYLPDVKEYIESIGLGPDALEITERAFLDAMKGRKSTIKGFLMDQKVLAGVGNLYADEVCYQTRVHPASITDAISTIKKKAIFHKMKEVLQLAIDKNTYYKYYPEDWFWKWREEGKKGPNGKGVIRSAKIAGRTTYFCSQWQKLYR